MPEKIRLDEKFVIKMLPKRDERGHKGSFGTLAVVGGSAKYRGAPLLAALGAYAAGCGIVRLCAIERVCAAAVQALPCAVLLPLEERDGVAAGNSAGKILGERQNAVLCGPGMENTGEGAVLVEAFLRDGSLPLVLDADGLNVLAGELYTGRAPKLRERLLGLLRERQAPTVLTPHLGEMARLSGRGVKELEAQQAEAAGEFAEEYGCVVVLKSWRTVVAAPKGRLWHTAGQGNSGLAKGGSGDVLAGIIGGLLAGGGSPAVSAALGVALHTLAARHAAQDKGAECMLPMDIVGALPEVYREIREEAQKEGRKNDSERDIEACGPHPAEARGDLGPGEGAV